MSMSSHAEGDDAPMSDPDDIDALDPEDIPPSEGRFIFLLLFFGVSGSPSARIFFGRPLLTTFLTIPSKAPMHMPRCLCLVSASCRAKLLPHLQG